HVRENTRPSGPILNRDFLRIQGVSNQHAVDEKLVPERPPLGQPQGNRTVGAVSNALERNWIVESPAGSDKVYGFDLRVTIGEYKRNCTQSVIVLNVRVLVSMAIHDGKPPGFTDRRGGIARIVLAEVVSSVCAVAGKVLRTVIEN